MATITAAQDGNWSDPATWIGGALPATSDTADCGDFTITLDQDITVEKLINNGSGQFFRQGGPITVTADLEYQASGSNTYLCRLETGSSSGGDIVVNGTIRNFHNANSASLYGLGVRADGNFTATINGDIHGGHLTPGDDSRGVLFINGSTSRLIINGNVYGGSRARNYGLYMQASSGPNNAVDAVIINGNCFPHPTAVITGAWTILNSGSRRGVTVNGTIFATDVENAEGATVYANGSFENNIILADRWVWGEHGCCPVQGRCKLKPGGTISMVVDEQRVEFSTGGGNSGDGETVDTEIGSNLFNNPIDGSLIRSRINKGADLKFSENDFKPSTVHVMSSSLETVEFLNRREYQDSGNLITHLKNADIQPWTYSKKTGGAIELPQWFKDSPQYSSEFFDLVSLRHQGDGYGTDLDDPLRFRRKAIDDVLEKWLTENPGQSPREYYIDFLNGNDSATGTPNDPLATFAGAEAKADCFRIFVDRNHWPSLTPFEMARSMVVEAWRRPGDKHTHFLVGNQRLGSQLVVTQDSRPNVWKVTSTNLANVLSGFTWMTQLDEYGFPGFGRFIDGRSNLSGALDSVADRPGSWTSNATSTEIYLHWPESPTFGAPDDPNTTHTVGVATFNRNATPLNSTGIRLALFDCHWIPTTLFNGLPNGEPRNRIWRQNCRSSHSNRMAAVSGFIFHNCELLDHGSHLRYGGSDGFYAESGHRLLMINPRIDHIGEIKAGSSHQPFSFHGEGSCLIINASTASTSITRDEAVGTLINANGNSHFIVLGLDASGNNTTQTFSGFGAWTGQGLVAGIQNGLNNAGTDSGLFIMDSEVATLRLGADNLNYIKQSTFSGDFPERIVINTD